jgi:hypothetical protein
MPQAVQGRGMRRDSLQGRGDGLPLLAYRQHDRLPRQVARVNGHQGRVLYLPLVASEELFFLQGLERTHVWYYSPYQPAGSQLAGLAKPQLLLCFSATNHLV